MMITPWSAGRPLVWDATCPDMFVASYRIQEHGKLLNWQRREKTRSISTLAQHLHPIAIEISGAIGPRSRVFLKELGRRLRCETGEAISTSQKLSVAVQRGNAAVILAYIPPN